MNDADIPELREVMQQLASALIGATPEHWNAATLELIVDPVRFGDDGVALSIFNPEYRRDFVDPTDELYDGARQLELLARARGRMWKKVTFRVWRDNDDWRFGADFEYDETRGTQGS
jgi:hypothetical protein